MPMQARERAGSTHMELGRAVVSPNEPLGPMGAAHAMRTIAARARGPTNFGGVAMRDTTANMHMHTRGTNSAPTRTLTCLTAACVV